MNERWRVFGAIGLVLLGLGSGLWLTVLADGATGASAPVSYKSWIPALTRQVNVGQPPAPLPTPEHLTPAPAVLVSPTNGELLTTIAPSLTVHNPFGAQQCKARVELSRRPDFAVVDWRFDFWWFEGDTTGPMDRNYLEGSTYYWRTKASLDGVTWGPWSSVWSFFTPSGGTVAGTPTLLAPADGTAVATLRPTFRWTAVPGATWYLLAVGRYTFMVEGTEMTPWVDLDPGVVQRWSVGARNGYGWGARSGEWTITTPAAAPDELELPR